MIVEDQQAAVALLMNSATHRIDCPVEVIETHISRIFLAGDRAYKMKRAVKLPYVDFSTPELRLLACSKEIELNARTAPGLYLGVRCITRDPVGTLALDGDGELTEALIEMKRFDQSSLLDRMALAGALTPGLMTETARMIANFHRGAPIVSADGGAANLAGVLDINKAGFSTSHVFDESAVGALDKSFRMALARRAALLDNREKAGKVRRCHGDLHLRNICLLHGEPRLFDCIEFNDQIATIDVLYDLAFLLMDLWHGGLLDFANLVMNRYLDEARDEDGFVLLPFFMAVRAAVRAHVTATQVAEASSAPPKDLVAEAKSYFDLARGLLHTPTARIIAIGGLSGSGKTTIAEALAAHIGAPPGARIFESDRIRKGLFGVPSETRLPEGAYRPEISDKVYREMAVRTGFILSRGGSVVADAVFERLGDRERIEKEAANRGIPFVGVWLEADPTVLRQRVKKRKGGPSDATVDILSKQLQRNTGGITWQRLDAARNPKDIVDDILSFAGP